MLNFEGIKCVLEKVLIKIFFSRNPSYMDPKVYNSDENPICHVFTYFDLFIHFYSIIHALHTGTIRYEAKNNNVTSRYVGLFSCPMFKLGRTRYVRSLRVCLH